jgi:hypothetical protein
VNPIAQTFQYTSNGVGGAGSPVGGGNAITYTITVPNLCYGVWEEEKGQNMVLYGQSLAIDSYFETNLMSWLEKFPNDDREIRIRRIEPDFVMSNNMTMTINSRDFAQGPITSSQTYTFTPQSPIIEMNKIDTINMGRLVSFRFESNIFGGDYLMGKTIYNYAPGDVRP